MSEELDKNDPLRALLVDSTEVDRSRIADVLSGRVAIDSQSGRLVLLPGYTTLDARRKILAVLLAGKAAILLNLGDGKALTNKEVTDLTGLPPGTAAPGLKSLKELRLIDQDAGKAYFVPNARIIYACKIMAGEDYS